MEERKKQPEKKLTYDELAKAASDLHQNYQRLMQKYQEAVNALNDRGFEMNAFFLDRCFRVLEHPDMYKSDFVIWCSDNIETALRAMDAGLDEQAKDGEEAAKEEKGEA